MGAPARKLEGGSKLVSVLVIGRAVVASLHGNVDFATADELFALIDDALDARPEVAGVVFDCQDLKVFWPGVPARGVAWIRRHESRVRAIAVVTRSRTVLAVAHAASVLLPAVRFFTVESRSEAVAAVQRAVGPKSRRPAENRP